MKTISLTNDEIVQVFHSVLSHQFSIVKKEISNSPLFDLPLIDKELQKGNFENLDEYLEVIYLKQDLLGMIKSPNLIDFQITHPDKKYSTKNITPAVVKMLENIMVKVSMRMINVVNHLFNSHGAEDMKQQLMHNNSLFMDYNSEIFDHKEVKSLTKKILKPLLRKEISHDIPLNVNAIQLNNIAIELEKLKYIDQASLFIKSIENGEASFKWLRKKDREFMYLIIRITKETTSFYHHEIVCLLRDDLQAKKRTTTQSLKTLKANLTNNHLFAEKNYKTINDLINRCL